MSEQRNPVGKLYAVKKITVKEVLGGKVEKEDMQISVLNDDGSPVLGSDGKPVTRTVKVARERDVCMIYGTAREHRSGMTSFGEFVEYIGTFEAKNLVTFDTYQSTRVIFPPIADDMALNAFMAAKERSPDNIVDMAFIIGVRPDARGTEGFKFTCRPLKLGERQDDPLAALRSSLAMNFAEQLGLEVMEKLGLPAPGSAAAQIPHHDAATGEVIEGEATEKKGRKPATSDA